MLEVPWKKVSNNISISLVDVFLSFIKKSFRKFRKCSENLKRLWMDGVKVTDYWFKSGGKRQKMLVGMKKSIFVDGDNSEQLRVYH